MSERTRHARTLFAPLGPSYDRVGAALSFGQDPLWRRFLVSRLPPGGHVLDVATGTGLVAAELLRRGFDVTGLDQSTDMLAVARQRFGGRVELVEASAEAMPFADDAFDHLTVTYLLRYVDDPAATVKELARVVRPGGVIASLEFGVPAGPLQPLWQLYVGVGLPLAGRALPKGWREVGDFLGASIADFWDAEPARTPARVVARSRDPRRGGAPAEPRQRRGDVGDESLSTPDASGLLRPRAREAGATTSRCSTRRTRRGICPTSSSAAASLPSPPGGAWARRSSRSGSRSGSARMRSTSCSGRPLRTRIPDAVLVVLAAVSITGACAIGVAGAAAYEPWLALLVPVGLFLVLAYNLELAGGRFHSDLWFGLAWGGFPVICGYAAVAGEIGLAAVLGALFAVLLSLAQRALSSHVRYIRRRTVAVRGELELRDGGIEPLDAQRLTLPAETALRLLSAASVALAAALVVLRI